jgi:uncharacterized protein
MIHPDTKLKFIDKTTGYGVVATKLIPKGTITWVLDELDREFSPGQIEKLDPIYQEILDTYTYRNNKGNFVLCWDHARFVNHSFKPSCFTTAYDFEIAIRDIHPGEQLTDDYGYLNLTEPFKPSNEGTRRKIVYPDDLLRFYKAWDKKILPGFKLLNKVDQPLQKLIEKHRWKKINDILEGKRKIDSLLTCYYNEKNNSFI